MQMSNLRCEYCHRLRVAPCRSTREMEGGDRECYDALMRLGGGERRVNQLESDRRASAWAAWSKDKD